MADTDGWNGPRGNDEDGFGRLLKELREVKQRLAAVERGAPLKSAGIGVNENGMVVDSSLDVAGDLNVSGNTAITGTLSLPNGIIDNDALAHPLGMGSDFAVTTGFSLPNAWTSYATTSITIPAGFTRMQFTALGVVTAMNTTPGTEYLITAIQRTVGGNVYGSVRTRQMVPSGFRATGFVPYVWSEDVVPGQTHTFELQAWTGGPTWAADVDNHSRIDVSMTFTR